MEKPRKILSLRPVTANLLTSIARHFGDIDTGFQVATILELEDIDSSLEYIYPNILPDFVIPAEDNASILKLILAHIRIAKPRPTLLIPVTSRNQTEFHPIS
jgi:hypothetical protein